MANKKHIRKEELTTKMHSEFTVPRRTDVQNRSLSALTILNGDLSDIDMNQKYADLYDIDIEELEDNLPIYLELTK